MKIQCDVCSSEEASVFCCADEAALCGSCDRRVHSANKLASRHRRLSLLHPSSHAPALCDICQERRGLLFCQDDRAILCRDCDLPIHSKNQLTAKHNRYLLPGAGISSSPTPPTEAGAALTETCSNVSDQIFDLQEVEAKLEEKVPCTTGNISSNNSSISEYLINTLPGWHVEDFLFDDDAATTSSSTATANSFDHQVDEVPCCSLRQAASSTSKPYPSGSSILPEYRNVSVACSWPRERATDRGGSGGAKTV
ncbi:putative B-box zinc finger protein 20 [Iris pallida]|uniref:B-box zinc finger protein 20 n=1 Tax=Iris pallida TaxID=29817 RepID=A0AAX6GJB5_IRIPA|nr:putative B-box zinc finger protein 20 [Iris pallida]